MTHFEKPFLTVYPHSHTSEGLHCICLFIYLFIIIIKFYHQPHSYTTDHSFTVLDFTMFSLAFCKSLASDFASVCPYV